MWLSLPSYYCCSSSLVCWGKNLHQVQFFLTKIHPYYEFWQTSILWVNQGMSIHRQIHETFLAVKSQAYHSTMRTLRRTQIKLVRDRVFRWFKWHKTDEKYWMHHPHLYMDGWDIFEYWVLNSFHRPFRLIFISHVASRPSGVFRLMR